MKKQNGLTLVEMMVAIAISSIVVLAVGGVLADAQRGYNIMYNRINSPVVQDSYTAKAVFDRIVRKASATIDPVIGTMSVKVYYYSAAGVGSPDMYALFYVDGGKNLILEEGTHTATSDTSSSTMVIAGNVQSDSVFFQKGACVQMVLHLNNGKEDLVITCSSIRHNK